MPNITIHRTIKKLRFLPSGYVQHWAIESPRND